MTEKMAGFMQDGIDRGDFLPHDKTVAMAIASIMVRGTGDAAVVDETELFARERAAFIRLAKTAQPPNAFQHDGSGCADQKLGTDSV